jgi:hypothetical protein
MIKDKEERLKKKQELADKHAKLAEKMEDLRRELDRLNDKDAAQKLQDAADQLDKAAQNLQNDMNPEPQQKQAREDLDKAKQDVKEKQEELARELLVKLADQLEGLKIRQAGLLERSESLDEKIMKRKSWTEAYLNSIDGNIEAQKGVAEDAEAFKDKVKETKVFHSLLDKAKQSMDEAGKAMSDRRTEGQERRHIENDQADRRAFNAEEIDSEKEAQHTIVRHQKQAVKRLDFLLDSIKDEIQKMDQNKEKRAAGDMPPDNDGNGNDGPKRPADGIPSKAELKALHAEQLDVLERTKTFEDRKLDPKKLTDAQQKELDEITADQANINELFRQFRAAQQANMPPAEPKDQKEKQPEPKKGEPK